MATAATNADDAGGGGAGGSSKRQTAPWNDDEVSALVTAVQIYPASSGLDRNVRWKKIAAMVGVGVGNSMSQN